MPISLYFTLVAALIDPLIVCLVAISGGAVLAAFLWLDRVEPEPRAAIIHAILWGATTAVSIALIGNQTVGWLYGETAKAVVAAPIFEELGKGLGIWWMVRKGRVRTGFDGIVYAGLVAGGFAAVENSMYFTRARAGLLDGGGGIDALMAVFTMRGVITPFAHPLLTLLTGYGIAMAAQKGRKIRFGDFWGLPIAVALHAGWNGSLAIMPYAGLIIVIVGYIIALTAAATVLVVVRKKATRLYPRWISTLAFAYNLTPVECETFCTWKQIKFRRKSLATGDRGAFDALHSAIVRLMEYHAGNGTRNVAWLVRDLNEARKVSPI
jgi:RsiW-degrading membrane proteinase PrsW (M82 family)